MSSSLQILCPFCLKEKLFRRPKDLRDHALQEHKREIDRLGSLKHDLFTESNGFWFSLVPREYRQHVEPTDPKSACASAARDLIRNWLGRSRETSRSILDWERGWKLAEEMKTKAPGKRNLERSLLMETEDASGHIEDTEPCTKTNKSDTYSPRRPAITQEQFVIHSIQDTVEGIAVLLYTQSQCQIWYRCILAKEITSDPKAYVSIVQKKAALKPNYTDPPTSMKEVGAKHLRTRDTIANTLGIPARLVTKLTYGIKLYHQPTTKQKKTYPPTKPKPVHDPLEEDDPTVPDSQFQVHSPATMSSRSQTSLTEYPALGLLGGEEIVLSDLEEDHEGNNVDHQRDYKEGNDIKTELSPETTNPDFLSGLGASGISGCFHIGDEKTVSEVVVHSTNKHPHHSSAIFESSDCEVIVLDTSHPSTDSRKKAFRLLSTGVMPVIPPAKREWTNVRPLVLLSEPQPLYWPPKDWESLSPDARLFAWEMAAFRLHTSGRQPKSLDWDRVTILTIFNMLALPGTAFLSVEELRRDELNMRQYNYSMMKKIVLNGTNSDTDRKFLRMMEHASVHRDKSTDWLTDLLDSHNVRLRLTK